MLFTFVNLFIKELKKRVYKLSFKTINNAWNKKKYCYR